MAAVQNRIWTLIQLSSVVLLCAGLVRGEDETKTSVFPTSLQQFPGVATVGFRDV